ncbi:hypothetical protein JTB14_019493 [Gonioctena quinquepunctata]|nr:hypothetical protein JTB14_019493 [Gonioctena quinquepunctata]
MKDEIEDTTKSLSECARMSSVPHLELLKLNNIVITTISPFPPINLPVISEDYPDYDDDQNVSKIIAKYESASNRLASLCYSNAQSLTLSMDPQREAVNVGNEFFKITVMKKFGQDILDKNIISQNVKVLASKDFISYINEEVSILLCTTTRNPFWWITKEKVTTPVAMLRFIVKNEIVHDFSEHFSISFENTAKNFSWIPFHQTETPWQPDNSAIMDHDFEKMAIFRIDVVGEQGYVVEFLDLTANDFLDVYISDFVKPTPDEFREKCTQIHEKNTLLFIPHEHHFNSWNYLSILPNKKMDDRRVAVKFRVYAMSCFTWQPEIRSWVFSCGAAETSTLTRIDCFCYHSSVLSGRITVNYVREERTVIFVEHELQFRTNLIIFVTVAVTFLLYCILLIIISLSSDWDYGRPIYFLSDIPGTPRYEYLLIVKTGYSSSAGTTSNVVIKIYGEKANSREHVLNSPDPDLKILQRGQEDWFLLETEDYLGDIEKLEIWFDCGGLKPSWYCSEIEIVDVQKNNYCLFVIEYRFEITTKEKYFYTAVPEKLDVEEKRRKCSVKRLACEGNHMWDLSRQEKGMFSKFQRLTVMLSIFLTTYTILLFLYGPPQLRNSDILDYYMYYGFYTPSIWVPICCLVIAFLLHLPIVHCFRYPCGGKTRRSKIICWCFLLLLVLVSMTSLLVLGFWVPHETVLLWLISAVASLLIYIVLLENIVSLAYSTTMGRTMRIGQIFRQLKPVLSYIGAQRAFVRDTFGFESLRPLYEHLYKPLNRSKIKMNGPH